MKMSLVREREDIEHISTQPTNQPTNMDKHSLGGLGMLKFNSNKLDFLLFRILWVCMCATSTFSHSLCLLCSLPTKLVSCQKIHWRGGGVRCESSCSTIIFLLRRCSYLLVCSPRRKLCQQSVPWQVWLDENRFLSYVLFVLSLSLSLFWQTSLQCRRLFVLGPICAMSILSLILPLPPPPSHLPSIVHHHFPQSNQHRLPSK